MTKAEGLYYLKLDFDFFEVNLKTKALIKSYGLAGSAFYIYIAIKLYKANECRLEYGDFIFDALAFDNFDTSEKVKQFIDDCIHKFKLFKRDGDYFHCPHVDEAVEKYENSKALFSESGKLGAKRRWGQASGSARGDKKIHPYPDPELSNISMTTEEFNKLVAKFGEQGTKKRCEKLSHYKASKGKKYASDYRTILSWESNDKESSNGTPGKPAAKSSKRFDPNQPLR